MVAVIMNMVACVMTEDEFDRMIEAEIEYYKRNHLKVE